MPQPNLWILMTMCGKLCPSLWRQWGLEVGPIGFSKGAKQPQPLPLSPFTFKPPPGEQVPATCSFHNSDLPDAQSNGANHDRGPETMSPQLPVVLVNFLRILNSNTRRF